MSFTRGVAASACVHVDYETQRRTPKQSARWFTGRIRSGA